MKVLITGGGGQLASELSARAPTGVVVTAPDRAALDVTDAGAVKRALNRAAPDLVVNAAGYTAVNRAETEAARAAAVNVQGAENVAVAAAAQGARIVHLSTDYVFDGAASVPYTEDADPNPINVYGRTKLDGERRVTEAGGKRALVIRASWVYSRHGRNFFTNMLQLMRTGREVRVVVDQVGTPTWAGSLADAIWGFAKLPEISGVLHWTDAGVASWYDFAVAIHEESRAAGLLTRPVSVIPITSDAFQTEARRPHYSVLDKRRAWGALGTAATHWRESLRRMIRGYRDHAA